MKNYKDLFNMSSLKRRSFLKLACLCSLGIGTGPFLSLKGKTAQARSAQLLDSFLTDAEGNQYFVPGKINTRQVNDNNNKTVFARVDGWWRSYPVREFDSDFHDWWIAEKSWYYDQLIAYFNDETDELEIPNGGHHHPMLTTYGRVFFRRGDSDFHLNTAVKGFTLVPKVDQIDYINAQVADVYATGDIPVDLFQLRKELYQDKSLWDKTRFATLELYSGRPINSDDTDGNYGFTETKTFQNLMVNPMATLNYMGLQNTDGTQSYLDGTSGLTPHYQFKGYCWLVSYYNPANTDYELKIAEYINGAHSGYHGGADDIATNIFLIVEQFNQTPSYSKGRGKRVVPAYTYDRVAGIGRSRPEGLVFKNRDKKKLTKAEKMEVIKKLRFPV